MNIKKKCTLLIAISFIQLVLPRSIHRKKDHAIPHIKAYWQHTPTTTYESDSWYIKHYPVFAINALPSLKHSLPTDHIPNIIDEKNPINTKKIRMQLETLVKEIKEHKTSYHHFDVVHKADFNSKKGCGFIVCKFKEFPLIIKLSLETPETFINPHSKGGIIGGIVPRFFHFMSGGANRHLTGLTRIPNLEQVNRLLSVHPRWQSIVHTPRKWFWIPENTPYITITGTNIGPEKNTFSNDLPSIYGIIADAINTKEEATLLNGLERNSIIMELCNDLHCIVDPHANNFVFSKNNDTTKFNITIIDTEHFPTMVGLPEHMSTFINHTQWYLSLAYKCFNDMFVCTKKKRGAYNHCIQLTTSTT